MIRLIPTPFLLAAVLVLAVAQAPLAQSFDTRAEAAYVLDQTTDTVLLEKNADQPLPPASMSKLMTLYMAFEAIADGRLGVDDVLPVSQHCFEYRGSTMFLDPSDRVRVEDLLRGVVVLSGNDASCVLGEALSPDGTEAGFARMMTARAENLGMMSSTFINSNGWPAAGQRMSMHDLGVLADRLITDFPTFYPLFAEQRYEFDGRAPQNVRNRNPLLGLEIGADGLKTGHTQEAGYGLVGSAKQGDRRVIFAITGLETARARAEEAEKIINWAFRQFAERGVAKAGTRLAEAEVWMGERPFVGLSVKEDLSMLVPLTASRDIEAEVIYNGPVEAPITAGDEIAELVIRLGDLPETRAPLVADEDVARGGFASRLRVAAEVLVAKFLDNEGTGPEEGA
ncbi:D-alanyl-D-alanine carboxypeptidase family protein [Salibaculum sp.]|uniref:D-alanyl-D-alanine carboxypeptidase family protein n=1 Tax=Salibaculum sp. TaxID=2855480 RepID=UPI002B45F843|nr:D-alanyl-D-alanine carboxypeptidase family protein [Salibaculum sp.]HKL68269.1 D-alanyl-D-alanine carboxypeptidase family protein [Salibaculum sp.]